MSNLFKFPIRGGFVSKSRLEVVSFVFVLFVIHFVGWFYCYHLLPYVFPGQHWTNSVGLSIHYFLGLFSYFNIMTNIWMLLITDTTSGSYLLPAIQKPKWFFCGTCIINSPPRAYHCEFCDRCVLKRDHHCVFLGICIGHSNFRYFLMLVFHAWAACFYLSLLNIPYTLKLLGGFSFTYMFSVMIPLLSWIFGVLQATYVVASFATGICSLICVVMFLCLLFHCRNIYNGQTTYERRCTNREYDLGWKRNVLEVLGYNFYLVWVFPLIPSPLPGNGIDFVTKASLEATKTM